MPHAGGYPPPPPPPRDPGPPPPPQNPNAVYATPESEQRMWALFGHIGGIFLSVIAPLVVFLAFPAEKARFANDQAKEALNFQITVLIAYFISGVLTAIGIGFLLIMVVGLTSFILAILAGIEAYKGSLYRYPLNIRFIK